MRGLYAFFFLFSFFSVNAQSPLTDSSFYAQSVSNSIKDYQQQVQDKLHIYNGKLYIRAGHGVKGTAFFGSDSLQIGSIFYDGRLYENTGLLYDLVTDNVVIQSYTKDKELVLVPEKIDYFVIPQHAFVRITADSTFPSFITTGFYEKLFDGKLSVLAKHQKVQRQSSNIGDNTMIYNEYTNYFVFVNNNFYRANSKSEFLATMTDKKDEIKKFIKSNKINFNRNKELSMIQVAEYYAQLKN